MATDSKRPGSRLAIVVIVLLAVSAAVIAMWRVSTTSTVQEAPYFPPGHIQIASNQKPAGPAEESSVSAPTSAEGPSAAVSQQPAEPNTGAQTAVSTVTKTPTSPSSSAVTTTEPPATGGSVAAGVEPTAPPQVPTAAQAPSVERKHSGLEPSLSDVRDSVEQWRQSWESRQAASYVEFYHPSFPGLTGFARQKNSVMGRAELIEVKVSELKLSLEPGFTKAQFKQHYKSNTYESFDIKTQHWVMTNSGPRIIQESILSLRQ
jgi:hypothetical protein